MMKKLNCSDDVDLMLSYDQLLIMVLIISYADNNNKS